MRLLRRRASRFFAGLALAASVLAWPAVALADWDQQSTVCVYYTDQSGACWVTWVDTNGGGSLNRLFFFSGNDSWLVTEISGN